MKSGMKIGLMLAILLSLAMGVGTVSGHFVECDYSTDPCCNAIYGGTYPLYGGQYTPVGSVSVSDDGIDLFVTYTTTGGWYITETHLAIADTIDGIPHNKGGPIPGKFAWKTANTPTTEVTYTIPLYLLQPNDGTLTILAHAVVRNNGVEETAWAKESCLTRLENGEWKYPGSKWATYFQYTY